MSDAVQSALDIASHDGPIHVGAIHGHEGGRTDNIPMRVPNNSYVLPADVVSGLPSAEGNTLAGHNLLNKLFKMGPYGSGRDTAPYGASASGPYGAADLRANGGRTTGASVTPIIAAGGEFVIPPHVVESIGGGDVRHGHKVLDAMVKDVRSKNIAQLKRLPGPVRGKG